METTEIAKTLVHKPNPRLAQGLVTHIERNAIDLDLARSQWRGDPFLSTDRRQNRYVSANPPP